MGPTYFGFFIDWLIQLFALTTGFTIASGSIFLGLCLYIRAMVQDIKIRTVLLGDFQSDAVDCIRIRSAYVEEIRFHMELLEYALSFMALSITFWSELTPRSAENWPLLFNRTHSRLANETRVIMNEVLFFRLLACSATVALDFFSLELNETLSLETIASLYDIATMSTMTFLYCYYSETVTEALLDVGDVFFYSPWYESAMNQNGLLAIISLPVQRAQREFRLVGFQLVECSLAVFLKVSRYNFLWEEIFRIEKKISFSSKKIISYCFG